MNRDGIESVAVSFLIAVGKLNITLFLNLITLTLAQVVISDTQEQKAKYLIGKCHVTELKIEYDPTNVINTFFSYPFDLEIGYRYWNSSTG